MSIIDALIVGVPKAGTTWLANTLNQNPAIELTDPKEPNLIASHKGTFDRNNAQPNWKDYDKYFKNDLFRIDASVHTFACPLSPKRIYDKIPKLKFILCVREPVSRTFSHWNMVIETKSDIKNNIDWSDFSLAWEDDRLREDTLYGKSMKRWLQYFSLENFLIIDSYRMKTEPRIVLREIDEFLNMDIYNYNIDLSKHANAANDRKELSTIGKIIRKLFSLIPNIIKSPIVKKLQKKDINIYANSIVSKKKNIQKITKNEYITCFQIVTEDLTLFEKITNFSTKHWIEHINDKINE